MEVKKEDGVVEEKAVGAESYLILESQKVINHLLTIFCTLYIKFSMFQILLEG